MKDIYENLHCHTSLGSMLDSMANVNDLFKRASELGQKSLAITDHGTLSAVYDARKASIKYGIKYIPGQESYFVDDVSIEPDKNDPRTKRRHIVLLAKNEVGYRNLLTLNWKGYLNLQHIPVLGKVFPRIDWKMLEEHHEGLIALTACGSGILARDLFIRDADNILQPDLCRENTRATAQRLKDIFGGDFYLELQPHELKVYDRDRKTGEVKLNKNKEPIVVVDQKHINNMLADLGKELKIKLVCTADVHYLNKEDAKIHDMLMAISAKASLKDPFRHRYEVEEFYMKSGKDMMQYFTKFRDENFAATLCANTLEITGKCVEPTYLDVKETRFPKFDCVAEDDYQDFKKWSAKQTFNDKITEDKAFMRYRCVLGFKKKFGHLKGAEKKKYTDRMMNELSVLEMHNFSSYMLVVSDFILKAKSRGISTGCGRGSVGGSLVAHLLDIHTVDPLQYGLLFERFHNKEKKSLPDIDTDFNPDGRDWVEQYIVEKYGKEKVAHVSNLSRMTPKVAIKDIARSLELGGSKSEAFKIANSITDSVPTKANTFDEALSASAELRKAVAQYPELEQYCRKLVGLERSYSTHAAGVVIGDIDLSTYVPLRIDKNGAVSVQYEKNRCESMGLIKMDLLGLEHLRIIDNTISNIKSLGFECPTPEELTFDDPAVWEDISKGHTLCLFQLSSEHMKVLCRQIKPKNIEDLALVNALCRPSAKLSRESYIARRDGREQVTYKYDCLEPALHDTLGVCVYEEQLAKLANCVAGWDLNRADGLRKLTKLKEKGKELAEKLKEEFIKDAMSYSKLKTLEAIDIWENIIEPFAGYGFNKAHAIFYSINGYQTAYYKHYFPACFMAAVLRSEINGASSPDRDSNLREFKKESKRLGLTIKVPDINKSDSSFSVVDEKTIVTGLAAVKGVGERAIENIIQEKGKGSFASFSDFLLRTSSTLIRKNVIQPLAKAGCFDSLGITRKNAHDHYDIIRTGVNKHYKKVASEGRTLGHVLFDFNGEDKLDPKNEWNKKEILEGEMEVLGEYVSGNANDFYRGFFTGQGITPLSSLKSLSNGYNIKVESILLDVKQRKTKKGQTYADCSIQDIHGATATMKIWPEAFLKYHKILEVGKPIRAVCQVNVWNQNTSLILGRIETVGA